jgi:hypothetical protein
VIWEGGVRLSGLNGMLVLVGVTAVGALLDGLISGGPGLILDLSLVFGAVTAAFVIEPRLTWLVIPMPPLVFVVMAFAAGVAGDATSTQSATRLAAAAGTWTAKGFIAMAAATLLVIAIASIRMTAPPRR